MIKGVLLKYDETLDTNGFDWADVFWEHYQKYHLPVGYNDFLEAYRYAAKAMRTWQKYEGNFSLPELLRLEVGFQFERLESRKIKVDIAYIPNIADDCAYFADYTLQHAAPALQAVSQQYPVALLTNSYRNAKRAAKDFEVLDYFDVIVESTGSRRRNPALPRVSAKAMSLRPSECVLVSRSLMGDILPAKRKGLKTIWLKGGKEPTRWKRLLRTADITITDIKQLPDALANLTPSIRL